MASTVVSAKIQYILFLIVIVLVVVFIGVALIKPEKFEVAPIFPCGQDPSNGNCFVPGVTENLSPLAQQYLPVLDPAIVREPNAPGDMCTVQSACILKRDFARQLGIANCAILPGAKDTNSVATATRPNIDGCYFDLSGDATVSKQNLEGVLAKVKEYDVAQTNSVINAVRNKVAALNTTQNANNSTIGANNSTIGAKTQEAGNWNWWRWWASTQTPYLRSVENQQRNTVTNLTTQVDTNRQVATSTFNSASFRTGCTPARVPIVQKQISITSPNVSINGQYFTLAYKYTTERARRNAWRPDTDPYNSWISGVDTNRDVVASDPLKYVMDAVTDYRNNQYMNEVFNSPDAYYIFIEVYNNINEVDKRLVGNVLFEKKQGQMGNLAWFNAANNIPISNSPNIKAYPCHIFGIQGHHDVQRRWFMSVTYNGCGGDPTMMVIPYGWPCWWDNAYHGRIFLAKEQPIHMGGYSYSGFNGRSYSDMMNFYSGNVMLVWACKKTNDPYQTASVIQANCATS